MRLLQHFGPQARSSNTKSYKASVHRCLNDLDHFTDFRLALSQETRDLNYLELPVRGGFETASDVPKDPLGDTEAEVTRLNYATKVAKPARRLQKEL